MAQLDHELRCRSKTSGWQLVYTPIIRPNRGTPKRLHRSIGAAKMRPKERPIAAKDHRFIRHLICTDTMHDPRFKRLLQEFFAELSASSLDEIGLGETGPS